jgi:hypothetical protein
MEDAEGKAEIVRFRDERAVFDERGALASARAPPGAARSRCSR